MGRRTRALLVVAVALVAAACRVEGRIDVAVARDGSGTVTVGVGLDADAAGQVGDLSTALRTSDLTDAGWTVRRPVKDGSLTWVRATKPFRSPTDLGRVLDEVGLLRSWRLRVADGFGTTTWRVSGRIVSTGAIDQFSDTALTTALDGLPVGLTPAQLATQLKSSGPIPLTVHVSLPGAAAGRTTYSVVAAGGPASSRRVAVAATESNGTVTRWFVLAALLAAIGALVAVAGRLRRDRARRAARESSAAP